MDDLTIRIESFRKRKGLTQEQIANELGMSRNNYHRMINRGGKMSLVQLEAIANILDEKLPYLLFGKIRDPEREKEIAELQANFEMLRLKHENSKLNRDKFTSLFNYYFNMALEMSMMNINLDIKKPSKFGLDTILDSPLSSTEKLAELIEIGLYEAFGIPEILLPKQVNQMITSFVKNRNLILYKDESGYSIRDENPKQKRN